MDIELVDPITSQAFLEQRLLQITNLLSANKGEEISVIDLKGKTDIARYMIIATALSTRHAAALADRLVDELKKVGHGYIAVEGQREANWVLVDTLDIIVHIFRPEFREQYNLEKMWQN
jgi:ribosome-associated protein